jgi:hypothetical protein
MTAEQGPQRPVGDTSFTILMKPQTDHSNPAVKA